LSLEIGLVSLIYNAVKDLGRFVSRRFEKEDPAAVVLARQKWKSQIEERVSQAGAGSGWRTEAIIRDVKRVDEYPNVDDKSKGISPWFRVGLLGTYHRGIMVGLRIVGLKFDDVEKTLRGYDRKCGEEPDLNAYLVAGFPTNGSSASTGMATSSMVCLTSTAGSQARAGNPMRKSCSARSANSIASSTSQRSQRLRTYGSYLRPGALRCFFRTALAGR